MRFSDGQCNSLGAQLVPHQPSEASGWGRLPGSYIGAGSWCSRVTEVPFRLRTGYREK